MLFANSILPNSAAASAGVTTPALIPVQPGILVGPSSAYTPPLLTSVQLSVQDPLEFSFIVHNGDAGSVSRDEFHRLVSYFLSFLTIPADEIWVNLSPDEPNRIIAESFGVTEAGRDLLIQDYLLKQVSASYLYPEDEVGTRFWERVYSQIHEKYGDVDIPVNTFNRVWIVPKKAVIYRKGAIAFIAEAQLKVLLDKDYLSYKKSRDHDRPRTNDDPPSADIAEQITREIIIPLIEKEVNTGKTFSTLRQIYYSLILATWYKKNLSRTLLGQVYCDQKKVHGIDTHDPALNAQIYAQYMAAFKKGAFNYIREEYDPHTRDIINRKYFAGGFSLGDPDTWMEEKELTYPSYILDGPPGGPAPSLTLGTIDLVPTTDQPSATIGTLQPDSAQKISPHKITQQEPSLFTSALRALLPDRTTISTRPRNIIAATLLSFLLLTTPTSALNTKTTTLPIPVSLVSMINPLATPSQVHKNTVIRLGDPIPAADTDTLKRIEQATSYDDCVRFIYEQKNPLTGKTYELNATRLTYYQKHWGNFSKKKFYDRDVQIVLLTFQHKMNDQRATLRATGVPAEELWEPLHVDGTLGPRTRIALDTFTGHSLIHQPTIGIDKTPPDSHITPVQKILSGTTHLEWPRLDTWSKNTRQQPPSTAAASSPPTAPNPPPPGSPPQLYSSVRIGTPWFSPAPPTTNDDDDDQGIEDDRYYFQHALSIVSDLDFMTFSEATLDGSITPSCLVPSSADEHRTILNRIRKNTYTNDDKRVFISALQHTLNIRRQYLSSGAHHPLALLWDELSLDGILGKNTRQAINALDTIRAWQDARFEESEHADHARGSVIGETIAFYAVHKRTIFDVLAILAVLIQSITIIRNRASQKTAQEIFLDSITDVINNNGVFRDSARGLRSFFPHWYRLDEITARRIGKNIHVIIHSENMIETKIRTKDLTEFERRIETFFSREKTIVTLQKEGTVIPVTYTGLKIKRASIVLKFEIPDTRHAAKAVTISFPDSEGTPRTVELPLSRDKFRETIYHWNDMIFPQEGEAIPMTHENLTDLVRRIHLFREAEGINPSKARDIASRYHEIRTLAINTVKYFQKHPNDPDAAAYESYFRTLAVFSNTMISLSAEYGSFERYRPRFIKSLEWIIKPMRIILGIEFTMNQIKEKIYTRIADITTLDTALRTFEFTMIPAGKKPQTPTNTFNQTHLLPAVKTFFRSIEDPREQGLVGRDLFRRHQRVMKAFMSAIFIFYPIAYVAMGLKDISVLFVISVPLTQALIYYYLFPQYIEWRIKKQNIRYNTHAHIALPTFDTVVEHSNLEISATPDDQQGLVHILSKRYFPVRRSTIILRANQFYEISAAWTAHNAEITLRADSALPLRTIIPLLRKDIDTGTLVFKTLTGEPISPHTTTITPDTTSITIHAKLPQTTSTVLPTLQMYYHTTDRVFDPVVLRNNADAYYTLLRTWSSYLAQGTAISITDLRTIVDAVHTYRQHEERNLSDFRTNALKARELRYYAMQTLAAIRNREEPALKKFKEYFETFARATNMTRFLAGHISTLDTFKSRFFSHAEFFGKNLSGIPIAKILRNMFGVNFLYSWAKRDALTAIPRLSHLENTLDNNEDTILALPTAHEKKMVHREKKLRNDFIKLDFGYRNPAPHSIVGGELAKRNFRMITLLSHLGFLAASLIIKTLVFFNVAAVASINSVLEYPIFAGLSAFDFSYVYYIIRYWIVSIHSYNTIGYEYTRYTKRIDAYRTPRPHELTAAAHVAKRLVRLAENITYHATYILGIFEPTVILVTYFSQQAGSFFSKIKNGNGKKKNIRTAPDINASIAATEPIGGIDLNITDIFEETTPYHAETPDRQRPPAPITQDSFSGFTFTIFYLAPIIHPFGAANIFINENTYSQQTMPAKNVKMHETTT